MSGLLDRAPFTALGLLWPGRPPTAGSRPEPDGDGADRGEVREVRLVAANALSSNRRVDRWAEAVLAPDPDVLCVAELTPEVDAALRARCASQRFAGGTQAVRPGSSGTGLWTRAPSSDAYVVDAGYALAVATTGGVTFVAVHTVAPTNARSTAAWRASFDALVDIVETTPGPLVLAGDWNATLAHGPLRDLLGRSRLRDAHTVAGRWRARTWPTWLPVPVAGLDRVLVSGEVAVRSISELRAPGSDHLAVVADLTVPA